MGAADGSIFSRGSLTVNDQQVYYLKGGREGEMEPLVYLHGLGGGGKWESFHMALGTATLTYAMHLPGFQDGAPPEGIASVRDYADVVTAFLDAEGLDKVILVGHSFGGWVALDLATREPERVSRLALVDAMGVDAPETPSATLDEMDEDALCGGGVCQGWDGSQTPGVGLRGYLGEHSHRPGVPAAMAGPESGGRFNWRQVPRPGVGRRGGQASAADTLLIWGRLDGIVPPGHGEVLRQVIPNSSLHVIDGAGHLPMSEKPETFNRIVRDFLIGIKEEIPDVVTV